MTLIGEEHVVFGTSNALVLVVKDEFGWCICIHFMILNELSLNTIGIELFNTVSQGYCKSWFEFSQKNSSFLADTTLIVVIEELTVVFGTCFHTNIIFEEVILIAHKTSVGILLKSAPFDGNGHTSSQGLVESFFTI